MASGLVAFWEGEITKATTEHSHPPSTSHPVRPTSPLPPTRPATTAWTSPPPARALSPAPALSPTASFAVAIDPLRFVPIPSPRTPTPVSEAAAESMRVANLLSPTPSSALPYIEPPASAGSSPQENESRLADWARWLLAPFKPSSWKMPHRRRPQADSPRAGPSLGDQIGMGEPINSGMQFFIPSPMRTADFEDHRGNRVPAYAGSPPWATGPNPDTLHYPFVNMSTPAVAAQN